MHASPQRNIPPASGGLSYYPARWRGKFPSVRAALASIGCNGDAAELHLLNARAEASDLVAVPVMGGAGTNEALALIRRKPGGHAELLIGVPAVALNEKSAALRVLADFEASIPGRWELIAWTRQARSTQ